MVRLTDSRDNRSIRCGSHVFHIPAQLFASPRKKPPCFACICESLDVEATQRDLAETGTSRNQSPLALGPQHVPTVPSHVRPDLASIRPIACSFVELWDVNAVLAVSQRLPKSRFRRVIATSLLLRMLVEPIPHDGLILRLQLLKLLPSSRIVQ